MRAFPAAAIIRKFAGAVRRRFITSIGRGKYQPCIYTLDGRGSGPATPFAPVAIARLKSLSDAAAHVLVTKGAQENYKGLADELTSLVARVAPLEVPEGRNEAELLEILEKITSTVLPAILSCWMSRIRCGICRSSTWRRSPYLAGLRGVKIEGIYYGAFELRENDRAPILDITALFELVQWHHALRMVAETGNLSALARQLRGEAKALFGMSPISVFDGRAGCRRIPGAHRPRWVRCKHPAQRGTRLARGLGVAD